MHNCRIYLFLLFILSPGTQRIWCGWIHISNACSIQGYDSGECRSIDDIKSLIPFCADTINYPTCVPAYQGSVVARWQNFTIEAKDDWVRRKFNEEWELRKTIETNDTLKSLGIDEYGNEGEVVSRFLEGEGEDWVIMNDCAKAYKNLFCWINFPRCDDEGNSLVMCKSACENYFLSCGYPRDMWRCGPANLLNGYEAEEAKVNSKGIYNVFLRSFFPGQPWRDNEFEDDGTTPIAFCTPSLLDGASSTHVSLISIIIASIMMLHHLFD